MKLSHTNNNYEFNKDNLMEAQLTKIYYIYIPFRTSTKKGKEIKSSKLLDLYYGEK